MTPDVGLEQVIEFTTVVSGSVGDFDRARYATNLASHVGGGITADDITLNVTAASVRVVATIAPTTADLTTVTMALNALAQSASAASTILQVDVTEVEPPITRTRAPLVNTVDSLGSAQTAESAGEVSLTSAILGVVFGMVAFFLLALVVLARLRLIDLGCFWPQRRRHTWTHSPKSKKMPATPRMLHFDPPSTDDICGVTPQTESSVSYAESPASTLCDTEVDFCIAEERVHVVSRAESPLQRSTPSPIREPIITIEIVNVKAPTTPPCTNRTTNMPLFVPDELSPMQSASKWLREREDAAGSSSTSSIDELTRDELARIQ